MKKILTYSILGICAGILLITSCKKDDVTPSNSNGSNSSSNSSSSSSSDDNPKTGSFTFNNDTYEVHKNGVLFIAGNGLGGGSVSTTSISGTTTLSGAMGFKLKSTSASITSGDYTLVPYTSSDPDPGKAMINGYSALNLSNITDFYVTSGKLTVSISGGSTTFTLTEVPANTASDGTGTDLGKITGSFTYTP